MSVELESEDKNGNRVPESGNDYMDAAPRFPPSDLPGFNPVNHHKTTSSKSCLCPKYGRVFTINQC